MSGPAGGQLPATPGVGDRRNLLAAVLVTTTSALPVYLVATMAVQIRGSLHFGAAGLGVAISLFYVGAAASSVPLSRAIERVGGARAMRVLGGAAGGLLLLLGTVAGSWTVLAVLLVAAGFVSGGIAPATNLFLARRSPQGHQGFAFGLKQSAVPLASLLGGLAVPVVALHLGWQWGFRLAAALALLAAVSVPASRVTLAERRRQYREQERPPVRTLPLVVVGVGFGLGCMAATGFTAFLVSGAVAMGYAKGLAGVLAAAAGLGAMVGRILAGVRADRRRGRHFRAVTMMLAVGAVGYGVVALAAAQRAGLLFGLAAVVTLGAGWGWNGLLTFAVVRSHADAPAAATGITSVGARLGGVAGPALLGLVIASGSYADAWLVAGGAAICGAATIFVGHRLIRTSAEPSRAALATGPG